MWLVCPSQPAEQRCEGHLGRLCYCVIQRLRHQLFPSRESAVNGCFGETLPPHFSCHHQLSCPLFLPFPWLIPPVSSRIISSWSSLHHCSSKLCAWVVGSSLLPNIFPAEAAEDALLRVTLILSAILGHLGGGEGAREGLAPAYAYFQGHAIEGSISTQFGTEIVDDGFARVKVKCYCESNLCHRHCF